MSYIYLAESGAESSAECFSDIPVFVLSKSNPTADKSCCSDNATEFCQSFQSGTTCEPLMASRGEEKLTSFAEVFPAKTYLAQERARESAEREADCGLNLQESLARYDPATHLWRTRQCSLFGDSDECLETFPKSGMMQGGVLWELMTLERPTDVSASGYWRTPDTGAGGIISDKALDELANGNWKRPSGSLKQLRLQDQVRHPQLWPTPTVCGNNNRKGLSKTSGDGLATVVLMYPTPNCSGMDGGSNSRKANKRRGIHQKLYPTPMAHDSKAAIHLRSNHQNGLGEVVHGGELTLPTKKARLNPNWVEWLMGWPIGWTDSKPLATDKFRSWLQQHLDY